MHLLRQWAGAFFEISYTCRNGACAQARSAQLPIERNQAFPVSPARDKGVPDGAEVQSPVALRGTCFVMRQVLFYADVSGFDSAVGPPLNEEATGLLSCRCRR